MIDKVANELNAQQLRPLKTEMGELPVYCTTINGKPLGIVPAAVGAPLAAALFEELIARGGRKFIACGGAGVLDSTIDSGHLVIPTSAIRDEGTSYHYLPADQEAIPSATALETVLNVLEQNKVPYKTGKTWTTDAFYRETPKRVATRKKQGCLTVEMEAAALFAVAEFRNVQLAQLLYGGDDVSGADWDPREFGQKIPARETLFQLAVESCLSMV